MTRISEKFAELSSRNEHALIGYAVAGYPDYDASFAVVKAMVEGGVDIIELGIPFSDPIADGPTIQKASYQALQGGVTPNRALQLARKINDSLETPLAIMTYCNLLYKPGFDNFLRSAGASGIDGVIIPDLTVEESADLKKHASKYDIDTIFLASPNTSNVRLKAIVKATSGFVYLVSIFGTTGERKEFENYTAEAIKHVKGFCKGKVPLAVGFGVSRSEHVKFMLDAGADAVIVGSAFVSMIEPSGNKIMEKLRDLATSLKNATKQNNN
jgi:tryptophan synthase alpha chain